MDFAQTDVPQASVSRHFYSQALANGILLRPIGNTFYLMPPYVISQAEIEFLVERATMTLEAALRQ